MDSKISSMFSERALQDWLALGITAVSVIGVLYLSRIAMIKTDATQILSTVLPLLGSWVGTVLAYYFSKDNFETASRSVSEMVDKVTQKDSKSILVTEKMIKKQNIYCRQESEISTVEIFKILQGLNNSGDIWTRLPILNDQDQVKHVFHRDLIANFLMKKYHEINDKEELEKCTLADLIKDDEFKGKSELFVIVSEGSTLSEAKIKMDKVPGCKDIFVTKQGQESEPVLGWVTNAILMENAKL